MLLEAIALETVRALSIRQLRDWSHCRAAYQSNDDYTALVARGAREMLRQLVRPKREEKSWRTPPRTFRPASFQLFFHLSKWIEGTGQRLRLEIERYQQLCVIDRKRKYLGRKGGDEIVVADHVQEMAPISAA